MSALASTNEQERSHAVMKPHLGRTFHDVAGEYPSLYLATLEAIQNAIDASAKHIRVTISQKTRFISIQDDGCGRTVQDFNLALTSINRSSKSAGKLGRFGKGLIAFLGKCEGFTFTSCPEGSFDGFNEWHFDSKKIIESYEPPAIPIRKRTDLRFEKGSEKKSPPGTVSWRTELSVNGYDTRDQHLSAISVDELERGILARYAKAMRRNNVTVSISLTNTKGVITNRTVKATQYRGMALARFETTDRDAGKITIRLYRVRKSEQGMGVFVGETDNDFTLPWANFYAQVRAPGAAFKLPAGVNELLSSGSFEGEILAENISLHPERTKLHINDAFVGLVAAIEAWFNATGSALMKELRLQQDEKMFQAAALKAVNRVSALSENEGGFKPYDDFLRKARLGSIGPGHSETGRETGKTNKGTAAAGGVGKSRSQQQAGESVDSAQQDPKPRGSHSPKVVYGDGSTREETRKDSIGLHIAAEIFDDDTLMFKTDVRRGLVIVNKGNPYYVMCADRSERVFQFFLDQLVIAAMNHAILPDNQQDIGRVALQYQLEAIAMMYSRIDGRTL